MNLRLMTLNLILGALLSAHTVFAETVSHSAAFNRAISFAQSKKESSALTILNQLLAAKSKDVNADLIYLTQGRIYYQMGQYKNALDAFTKVNTGSEFWLEAIEEKAHTYGKMGDYAKAISTIQTPMVATFKGIIGPEPYFVAALTHLKICNYTEIFAVTKKFKENFNERITALNEIATKGTSKAVDELAKRLKTNPKITFELVGSLQKELPRYISRDHAILGNPATLRVRAQSLAKKELKEIEDVINKMQIIEAEVIHRINLADEDANDRDEQGDITKNSNVLVFPMNDEVWLDEIDNYQAKIQKCPQTKKQVNVWKSKNIL